MSNQLTEAELAALMPSELCQSTKSLRDSPLKRGPTRGRGNQMRDRR
jgi:hypothetical protein